jgi:Xaa-Pro aminopeptidase
VAEPQHALDGALVTEPDLALLLEKHAQLDALLPHLPADAWVVLCREGSDASTLLFAGAEMVGLSAFVFTPRGAKIAIVADYDRLGIEEPGVFHDVIAYGREGLHGHLRDVIARLRPTTFALNQHVDDYLLDGMTVGLLRTLERVLGDDTIGGRAVSSESVLGPLRARKTPEELRRIERAVEVTQALHDEAGAFMRSGMTEREVAEFIKRRQRELGVTHSFSDGAAVMTGRAGLGHRTAGDAPITPGDTVVIDMGIFVEGYTSDIMHTYYVLDRDEQAAPRPVQARFDAAMAAVHESVAAMRPGVAGHEVDGVARGVLERHGVEPYSHALGHQIGRSVHDGGTTLAPLGERYGERGLGRLVAGEVYTVEPVVHGVTDRSGHPIGPEQDVVVTADGARFLSRPQRALTLVR